MRVIKWCWLTRRGGRLDVGSDCDGGSVKVRRGAVRRSRVGEDGGKIKLLGRQRRSRNIRFEKGEAVNESTRMG